MSEKKKNIRLILLDHCSCFGGAQISLLELKDALERINFPVLHISPSPGKLLPVPIRGERLPLLAILINSIYLLTFFVFHRFPRIYCNSLRDRLSCFLIPPKFLITHIRDYPSAAHMRMIRLLPSRNIVVSSNFIIDILRQKTGPANIHYVPNIIRFSSLKPEFPGNKSKQKSVVMVANLVPWKKHLFAIEVMIELRKNGIIAGFDIWGSDALNENQAYAENLRKVLAQKEPIGMRLIENNRITAEDYARYDLLFHPAENEPFGRVIIEALGNGVPVLVHASGDPPNVIKKYGGGEIFDSDDAVQVAEKIAAMIGDKGKYEQQIHQSIDRIRNDFSPQSAIAHLKTAGII